MLIKLLGRKNLNLFNQQLRKCQTKCAINQLNLEEDENQTINKHLNDKKLNNQTNQNNRTDKSNQDNKLNNQENKLNNQENKLNNQDNKLNNQDSKLNNQNVNQTKSNKKRALFHFDKPKADPNVKSIIRVKKYKKAMGLPDDLPFDESAKIINEFIDQKNPGLHFFPATGSPIYGANFNTPIWYRLFEKRIAYKHIAAELFEKNVIFDFSYDSFMNRREKYSLVFQLLVCLGLNNRSKQPFPILLANLDKNSFVYEKLHHFYLSTNKMIKLTEQSYLDLIPKEEIIYLSPHAEESLTEFNPDYHYVIGCFIDISFSKCLSYKKAQAEGVKCYKLPIDEFVAYSKKRNKLLPLPIVHQILLDKKSNTDWKSTLECNLGANRLDIEMKELEDFQNKYKNIKTHLY